MFVLNENSSAPVAFVEVATPTTFAQAWELAWSRKIKLLKYSECENLRYKKHLKPLIGEMKISEITPFLLEQLKNYFLEKGLADQTVTHIIGLVRRVYSFLILDGSYDQVNPVSKIKLPKADNRRMRFLTPFEAQELLANLKERSEITWELSLLCLTTGLRPKEIYRLKGEHVDIQNMMLHVLGKNKKFRTVYIPEVTANMLTQKNLKSGRLVFTYSDDKQITAVSDTFARVVKQMGLNRGIIEFKDKLVFYSLRHTYASWMAQDGQPLALLSELMGHSSLQMTMRYIHLSPARKKAATGTIDKIFENIHGFEVPCKENMQLRA